MTDLPTMTGAELRASREYLGLTGEQMADRLGVAWRSVARWESDGRPVPDGVAEQVADLTARALITVEAGVEAMSKVDGPMLGVPRAGEMDGWPAATWRMIGARMAERLPGLRIVYRDET